jgi:histidine triad (HIT) family protein
MASIFSKIIAGDIPSYKVYEDEHVFAFLDINPMQKGHTLVVPKKEVDYLFDLDATAYTLLLDRSKYVANILKTKLGCKRIAVIVEGYAIAHAHIHLIPTNHADDLDKKHVHVATKEELENVHTIITS